MIIGKWVSEMNGSEFWIKIHLYKFGDMKSEIKG